MDAVARVSGARDVLVLDTFMGLDRETGALVDAVDNRRADIYVEWRRSPGQFGLEIHVYGPPRRSESMSEAELARRLARTMRCAFVISDCHANPYSYFRIDPDGAMHRVYTRVDDDNGNASFDIVCDLDPSDPAYIPSTLMWPADEPFPKKPADAPDHMPATMRRFCMDRDADDRLCEIFWDACPYLRLART